MNKNCYKNMGWMHVTLILCMFGFLKEFRPNEPFITDYLTGKWKNFTTEQVTQEIYPVGTYSYLATLVVVFLLTDFARYKPIIILCGLSGTLTFVVMIVGKSMASMQFLEFTYGIFMSTEVAYYTYIYAKVDKNHYQAVSSYTRAAFLLGRFLSGTVAQLTTSFDLLDYHQLIYLNVAGLGLATFWALFLPPVDKSLYFHRSEKSVAISDEFSPELRDSTENLEGTRKKVHSNFIGKLKRSYLYLWQDFVRAYTNFHVVKWSLWWSFATCGYFQVWSYIQPLWKTAVGEDQKIYNGAVDAAYTIIGALAVFGVGRLRLNWPVLGEAVLSVFSILEAGVLFILSKNTNIWHLYAAYIVFGVIYHTMITVASFEVAKNLPDDSYGLVFGINTLFTLVLQSLLTFVVVSGRVFQLDIRTQFQIYAGYFLVLGAAFMLIATHTIARFTRGNQNFSLWLGKQTTTTVVDESPS